MRLFEATSDDWLVVLVLPDGTKKRIGVSPSVEKAKAIEAAIRSTWTNWADRRSLRRNPFGFSEHCQRTRVVECKRRSGLET